MSKLLYQDVADKIEDQIKCGKWKTDDKLPSERILAQEYHVSRTVVREAIKTLNEKKVIINRPGKGNYVSCPDNDSLTSQFESLVSYNNISIPDLIEAREELEVVIGARAIKNITRSQLKEMTVLYQLLDKSLSDSSAFNQYDYSFHVKLAECSGNNSLKMIFVSLYSITGRSNYASVISTLPVRQAAQKDHLAILTALKSRSPRNMSRAIRNHMKCIREHMTLDQTL